jgi:lipoprotein NlpI
MNFVFLLFIPVSTLAFEDDSTEKVEKLWESVRKSIDQADYRSADKSLTSILAIQPKLSNAFYYRGRVRFQAGEIKDSVADFDQHVSLSPGVKSRQWERGISLYYLEKYGQGAKQFEIYQTYHDNDVENSAWRFLCVAKADGIEAAKKNLLPIRNDRRVPMMQIYEMYRGNLTPTEVLAAAEKQSTNDAEKNSARFYANLYIGLLYEVQGQNDKSKEHIRIAKKHKIAHYMWDVANVHLLLRKK